MKRFARAFVVMVGVAVLGFIVSLVPQKNATAQGGPTVTIASPLPLPVKGSVNVTGTVGAQQSGPWNVGLTGTPGVSVSNLPAVQAVSFNGTAQPVTFSNTRLAPVFVDTNAPARSAVSGECSSAFAANGQAACDLVDVPSGKILVVDTVSALIEVSAGKVVQGVLVIVEANDVSGAVTTVEHHLPVSLVTSTAFGNAYAFAGPLTLYAISNNPVLIRVFTDDASQTGQFFFSFSGHLVTP